MIIVNQKEKFVCSACSKVILGNHIAWLFPDIVLRFHFQCAKDFSAGLYANVLKFKNSYLERN